MSKRSHNVQTCSLNSLFGAAIGSENPQNGSARFTNPFLYSSSFFC